MSTHSRACLRTLVWLSFYTAFGTLLAGHGQKAESADLEPAAEKCTEKGCGKFGTEIHWVSPRDVAARKAREGDKLLLVMHLSGNFAKQAFT